VGATVAQVVGILVPAGRAAEVEPRPTNRGEWTRTVTHSRHGTRSSSPLKASTRSHGLAAPDVGDEALALGR
jgi:hypothetical protein